MVFVGCVCAQTLFSDLSCCRRQWFSGRQCRHSGVCTLKPRAQLAYVHCLVWLSVSGGQETGVQKRDEHRSKSSLRTLFRSLFVSFGKGKHKEVLHSSQWIVSPLGVSRHRAILFVHTFVLSGFRDHLIETVQFDVLHLDGPCVSHVSLARFEPR